MPDNIDVDNDIFNIHDQILNFNTDTFWITMSVFALIILGILVLHGLILVPRHRLKGYDFRTRVLLDRSPSPAPEPLGAAAESDRLTRSRPSAEHIALEVEIASAAVVVASEAFDPGWSAKVDGLPAPIMRAYGVSRIGGIVRTLALSAFGSIVLMLFLALLLLLGIMG